MNKKIRAFAEFVWAFLAALNMSLSTNIYSFILWTIVMLIAFVLGADTIISIRRCRL